MLVLLLVLASFTSAATCITGTGNCANCATICRVANPVYDKPCDSVRLVLVSVLCFRFFLVFVSLVSLAVVVELDGLPPSSRVGAVLVSGFNCT